MLLVGLALVLSAFALYEQSQSVNEACKIQQRGLHAGEHLTQFFLIWDQLIAVDNPANRKSFRRESKLQQRLTLEAIHQLDAYVAVQRKQPKTRVCQ